MKITINEHFLLLKITMGMDNHILSRMLFLALVPQLGKPSRKHIRKLCTLQYEKNFETKAAGHLAKIGARFTIREDKWRKNYLHIKPLLNAGISITKSKYQLCTVKIENALEII